MKNEQANKSSDKVVEEALAFLARWLASHILENDRHMAYVVLAIKSGLPVDVAKRHALEQMSGSTRVLIEIILSIYESLSNNTLHLMRELAERKQAAAGLEASELRYRSLAERLPLAIQVFSPEGKTLRVNQAWEKIWGVPFSALSQYNIFRDKQLADIGILSKLEKAFAGETVEFPIHKYEKSLTSEVPNSGGYFWLRVFAYPVLGLEGELLEVVVIQEDITERKQAEELLAENRKILSESQSIAGVGSYAVDIHSGLWKSSDVLNQLFGIDETYRRSVEGWEALIYPDDRVMMSEYFKNEVLGNRVNFDKEYRIIRHSDQAMRWVHGLGKLEFDEQGRPVKMFGTIQDITEHKKSEESLRITASVFGSTQEGILITDASNNIVDVNPAFTRITGYDRIEVVGKNPKLLSSGRQSKAFYATLWKSLQQDKFWRGEIWNRRKSGEVYAELLSISVICDDEGEVQRYVAVFSDISHLMEHEAALSRIAHYDALTGVPNRLLLADRMSQAISQAAREQNMMAICYLDLDSFKPVNDSLGHEAGDAVLVEVAKRIERTIRGGDTVARLGGDEFVLLLLGLDNSEECVVTLERLLEAISLPIIVNEQNCNLSASIGISMYPQDNENPDMLLRYADQAMYVAKKAGRNRFYSYGQISKSSHVNRKEN